MALRQLKAVATYAACQFLLSATVCYCLLLSAILQYCVLRSASVCYSLLLSAKLHMTYSSAFIFTTPYQPVPASSYYFSFLIFLLLYLLHFFFFSYSSSSQYFSSTLPSSLNISAQHLQLPITIYLFSSSPHLTITSYSSLPVPTAHSSCCRMERRC